MEKTKLRKRIRDAFKCSTILNSNEVKSISFSDLNFQSYITRKSFGSYNFSNLTRGKRGLFIFKDRRTNKIITKGSTTSCLYTQITMRIYRLRIPPSAKLAVVICPEDLISKLDRRITESYASTPIYDSHQKIVRAVEKGKPISIGYLHFFNLHRKEERSTRNSTRQLTNLSHLIGRQGIYLISETEKGKDCWEIVYGGMASGNIPDLARRIYHHFTKDRYAESPKNNYSYKLETHDYKIAAVDIRMPNLSRKEFRRYLANLEKLFIKQFDPRDNVLHKVIQSNGDKSLNFDEGERWTPPTTIPEVAGTFEIAPF